MKRIITVFLALAIALALTGCFGGDNNNATTVPPSTTSTAPMTTASSSHTMGGSTTSGTISGSSSMPYTEGASVMFGSKVYTLTGETIRTDELGSQILSTSSKVTGTPAKEGEGFGIEKGTKIYQLKNNTKNDSVAVEIEGTYYRATVKSDATTKR